MTVQMGTQQSRGQDQGFGRAVGPLSSRLLGAGLWDFANFLGDTEVRGGRDSTGSPGMGRWWLSSRLGSLMVAWQWRVGGAGVPSGGSCQLSVTRNSRSSWGSVSTSLPRTCSPSRSSPSRSSDRERASGSEGVTLWAVQATSWSHPATRAAGETVSWFGKAVGRGLEEGGLNPEGQHCALRRGHRGGPRGVWKPLKTQWP